MKICYLANAASIHTRRWARYFESKGNRVAVVSFEPGTIKAVPVHRIPKKVSQRHLNILLNLPKIRRIVQSIDPDILHAHYVTSYGLAGVMAACHPLVMSAWGSDVLVMPEESIIYRQLVRYSMQKADLVTSIADHMTDLILQRCYTMPDKVVTFPFGVDTDVFNLKGRTSANHDKCIVVSNRRLDTGLDVDVFIRSIPKVLDRHPEASFIVAGDGPLRPELELLSKSLRLFPAVKFIGSVEHDQMPLLLKEADIFVSTSRTDGNNISLNEAMACGSFPIATNIDANRNWIENGSNGLLFPCRDVSALSHNLIEAIEKPDWRESVVDQNWDIIQRRASWNKEMQKMERIYQDLLDANPQH